MRARESRPRLLQAMVDAFSLPDLRVRLLFTLAILILFRFIAQVPAPIVTADMLDRLMTFYEENALFGMLDLFSGGAMRDFSIVAMGVYPYITASIIMQLLVPVIPRLQSLAKEGESGREKINMYTHWLMVPLAALQGYGLVAMMRNQGLITAEQWDPMMIATTIVVMTCGSLFLVWLGERITERGIGNGISLIIFSGIIVTVPEMMWKTQEAGGWWTLMKLGIFSLAIVVLVVYVTEAYRRIPVQYSRSVFRGRRMYRQAGSSHIPLRVNMAGMIPLIFAMALVMLPGTIASYFGDNSTAESIARFFDPSNGPVINITDGFEISSYPYWLIYFALVIGFAFFYTMVTFEQQNLAENLQRQGGFIPGIRPGKHTSEYLDQVVYRITWGGAIFLGMVAIAPFFTQWIAPEVEQTGFMILSSAGALIVVGVALDTMRQIEAQLLMRRYEGFLR
ncbi:MAG: preprotein translocase subunit SecY [Chloroflexota bacterium]|nr:preprotein translocase subunit SecY [Chloroflexota bacterium]